MRTSAPIMWRLKDQRYQMTGSLCPECQQAAFPPRAACAYCAANTEAPFPISTEELTKEVLAATYLIEAHA